MSVTAAHLPVGSTLAAKYRIEALLGQGGMGAVYLAENLDIGRKVAIKVLHPSFAADPQTVQRFRMEARAAAAIGHPGIVDVLDIGAGDDGTEFIVMERLIGETLGARIREQRRLASGEAVEIVCELLDALAAAHEKGIVHRDLKPENVFLVSGAARRTKILDFGISKFSGVDGDDLSVTATGAVMGTPLYMSPEQARNAKEIGPATDLYAVGAILYAALAGRPPITGDSYAEVLAKVLTEPHVPLGELAPEVTPALASVVDRLLAKNPSDRPSGALAARDELRGALDGGAVVEPARPAAMMTAVRPAAPPRRKSLLPIVAVVLAGVGVVGGGLVISRLAAPVVGVAPPVNTPPVITPPVVAPIVFDAAVAAPAVVSPAPHVNRPPRDHRTPTTTPTTTRPAPTGSTLGIDKSNPFQD